MDYQKHYDKLIDRARTRSLVGYSERHHIIPICMGGPDISENKVRLTPEEHYTAHLLLVRIHPQNEKLVYAAHRMCSGIRPSNKLYGWLKRRWSGLIGELNSIRQTGCGNSQYGSRWITDGIINKKILNRTTVPIGWRCGRVIGRSSRKCPYCNKSFIPNSQSKYCSNECRVKSRAKNTWTHSLETKIKFSVTRLGKRRGTYKK